MPRILEALLFIGGPLVDVLGKGETGANEVRQEALFALRHWLSRGPDQGSLLYNRKTKTGVLSDKAYSNIEAQIIGDLLYAIPQPERLEKETFAVLIEYLRHKKQLIRTLAHSHLAYLVPEERIAYNPAASAEEREKG